MGGAYVAAFGSELYDREKVRSGGVCLWKTCSNPAKMSSLEERGAGLHVDVGEPQATVAVDLVGGQSVSHVAGFRECIVADSCNGGQADDDD
jgi:hypothetical protein